VKADRTNSRFKDSSPIPAVRNRSQNQPALRTFREGNADFADCLIERSPASAGCEKNVTFDRAAAKTDGMVLIE
jgi:predicted nucleic-acid-binding protein